MARVRYIGYIYEFRNLVQVCNHIPGALERIWRKLGGRTIFLADTFNAYSDPGVGLIKPNT